MIALPSASLLQVCYSGGLSNESNQTLSLPMRHQGSELTVRPPTPLSMQFAADVDGDRLNLRALVSLIRRQILMIATIVIISVTLAFLVTQNSQRLYTANADVLLKPTTESITPDSSDSADDRPRGAEQIETEVQFIQSRDLAGKVFDQVGLDRASAFVAQLAGGGRISGLLKAIGMRSDPPLPPPGTKVANAKRETAINILKSGLVVRRIGNSFALRLSVTNADPALAAKIANGYAQIYSDNQIASKVTASKKAVDILQKRMDELRVQAQTDFGAVQQYRISNSLQSKSGTSLTEQEISAYNQQVALARAEASQNFARLAAARGGGAVGDSATSTVVNALRGQRATLSVRFAELSDRYLPSHPELISAREQLADIDTQIATEVSRAIRNLQADAQVSAARLSSLQGSMGAASGKLATNNRALVNLDDLERRAGASQALYESYLNRYKEVVAKSGAEQANSTLLSAATVPLRPSSPNLPLNLALGLLIGTLVGTASAVAVEGTYGGFTTTDDVERRLLVRSLGSVPLLKSVDAHADTAVETIAASPGGAFAESIRSIITAVRQSTNSRNQVIAVTSAMPEEGKTTLAACLARTAAMAHERVAILDCDVVRRNLSLAYGTAPGLPGLGSIFQGILKIEDFPPNERLGGATLFALTEPFEVGARLLEQGKLHRLIAQLREQFDVIILDCGPILPIAETRDIVSLADNVVVVTRWRATTERVVRAALKMLPLQTLGDLGVVLNGVDLRKKLRFGDGDPQIFSKNYKNYYPKPIL
jgi:polysaccharide biosynthesis transport protein